MLEMLSMLGKIHKICISPSFSGGLGSYTPSKMLGFDNGFQLGVTRPPSNNYINKILSTENRLGGDIINDSATDFYTKM